MKTKKELVDRLIQIEESLFNIKMVDRWQEEDKKDFEELTKEKQELEKEMENYGDEN